MKKTRIQREKEMLPDMIAIYCHGNHHTKKGELCASCAALQDYALGRLQHCKFGNDKTFCSQCPVHCYKPDMRAQIKEVMKCAGPRTLFFHPIAGTAHAPSTMQGVIKAKKEKRK